MSEMQGPQHHAAAPPRAATHSSGMPPPQEAPPRRSRPINERPVTATTSRPNVPPRARKVLANMAAFGPGAKERREAAELRRLAEEEERKAREAQIDHDAEHLLAIEAARRGKQSRLRGVPQLLSEQSSGVGGMPGADEADGASLAPGDVGQCPAQLDAEQPPRAKPSASRSSSSRKSALDASDAAGGPSRPRPPPVALFSDAVARQTAYITSKTSLEDKNNPITHAVTGQNQTLYTSASSGHQVGDGKNNSSVGGSWWATRLAKLKEQAAESESQLFRSVQAYINGFTGETTTRAELSRLLQMHGASIMIMPNGKTTHIISAAPLSAKKTHELLARKVGSRGPTLVHVDWVFDSIAAGKRRSEHLYGFATETQGSIASMFGPSEPSCAGPPAAASQAEEPSSAPSSATKPAWRQSHSAISLERKRSHPSTLDGSTALKRAKTESTLDSAPNRKSAMALPAWRTSA